MLELAHLVVAGADRLIGSARPRSRDSPLRCAAFERGLELLLQIVLAALDLVDDRLFVAAGDRGLEVEEALVGLAQERAAVLGLAAQPADFGAQLFDDALALVWRARGTISRKRLAVDVRGGVLIAGDAVDRGRDQRVERG